MSKSLRRYISVRHALSFSRNVLTCLLQCSLVIRSDTWASLPSSILFVVQIEFLNPQNLILCYESMAINVLALKEALQGFLGYLRLVHHSIQIHIFMGLKLFAFDSFLGDMTKNIKILQAIHYLTAGFRLLQFVQLHLNYC